MGLIGAVVIGVIVAALIAWVIISHVKGNRAQAKLLEEAGFAPCPEASAGLKRHVEDLRDHSIRDITDAHKAIIGSNTVYWYSVDHAPNPDGKRVVHEEFPLTLKRQSPEPVILNLKPAALGSGVASKMVEGVLSSSDAMSPRTLGKLALPPDQAEGPILSAMGRNGAKLYDLLHSRELSAFRQGAKHGVLSVRCAGDLCSVQLWSAWGQRAMKLGWRDAWIFVQQLVKLADQPHRA